MLISGSVPLLILIVLAALPLWMPWILAPVGEKYGLEFDSYQRIGYARFALQDVRFENDAISFSSKRIEAFQPAAWLVRILAGRDKDSDFISVTDWQLAFDADDDPGEAATVDIIPYKLFEYAEGYLLNLSRFLPRMSATGGETIINQNHFVIDRINWEKGILKASAGIDTRGNNRSIELTGDFRTPGSITLQTCVLPYEASLSVSAQRTDKKLRWEGDVMWQKNHITFFADFTPEDTTPAEAGITSQNIYVPGKLLPLEQYRAVEGSFGLDWHGESFDFALHAHAKPTEKNPSIPPIELDIVAGGDLERIKLASLNLNAPPLIAELQTPLTLDYKGRLPDAEPASITAEIDLEKQPFFDGAGKLKSVLNISGDPSGMPEISFNTTGEKLTAAGVSADYLDLGVNLTWVNNKVKHKGTLDARRVKTEDVIPGDLEFTWDGKLADIDRWDLIWENEKNALAKASGTLKVLSKGAKLRLGELLLQRNAENYLEIRKPASFRFEFVNFHNKNDQTAWILDAEPLILADPDRKIEIGGKMNWPHSGALSAEISNVRPSFLNDFIRANIPDLRLEQIDFVSSWVDGSPLHFDLETVLEFPLSDEMPVIAAATLTGGEEGIRIKNFDLHSEEEILASADGFLPLSILPATPQAPIEIHSGRDIDFRLVSKSEAQFWENFQATEELFIKKPELKIQIDGTMQDPDCRISLICDRIKYANESETPAPTLDDIELFITLRKDEAVLNSLSFSVEGQKIQAEGRLPLGADKWHTIATERKMPDWGRADSRIWIDEASIEPFALLAPDILVPEGTVSFELNIREGEFESGELTLQGASTRPLLPPGALRDINALISFKGRTVTIEEISALLGGEEVALTGDFTLDQDMEPHFHVEVKGENIPLVRQPGTVIRGDIDIAAKTNAGESPSITGSIRMRDSAMVSDWRSITLLPGPAAAERRPPFFSVGQEPFSDWTLDIDIIGDEFLSVRAPAFRGDISMDFALSGTLQNPVSTGEVQIVSGTIRFPFATMQITSGIVYLTPEAPYTPQLSIIASTQTFGYDIQMTLHGTDEDPVLEFSSQPPLSSQAILMMITAGELPRDELVFTRGQRATRMAIYMVRELWEDFGGEGDIAERLTIRTGEHITERGRETYYMEYSLLPWLDITGEYDRFDAFNLGLKWKFYTR